MIGWFVIVLMLFQKRKCIEIFNAYQFKLTRLLFIALIKHIMQFFLNAIHFGMFKSLGKEKDKNTFSEHYEQT